MATDTRIPLMGQPVNSANPLAALASGMAEKQKYDQQVGMQQEQQQYDRTRQAKMDNVTIDQAAQEKELNGLKILKAQYDNANEREKSQVRSMAINAVEMQSFAGDNETAKAHLMQRIKSLDAREAKGENIHSRDSRELLELIEKNPEEFWQTIGAHEKIGYITGAIQPMSAKETGDFTLGEGQKRFSAQGKEIASGPPKPAGAIAHTDPVTGEVTYTNPAKAMPTSAVKLQNETLDAFATANNIQADLGTIKDQIDTGKMKLGVVSNAASTAQNYVGASDESSRNYSTFQSTLEKLRNDSLRLNKGVQTEGDAERAWNELFQNLNDEKLVSQGLGRIQQINQRAAELKQLEVDNIRANYNQPPLDYEQYKKKSVLETQTPADGMLKTPSGIPYKVVQ